MRAKISVATFADTVPSSSRTIAWTARSSSRSGSPGVRPANARTRVRSCAWVAGWSAAKRAETTSSSAAASCQLTPSARRPNTCTPGPSRGGGEGQHERFGDDLPDHAGAARPQCVADDHLRFPQRRPRE
ncbi:MAG TPA: hypothetical protein VFN38_17680, partial [Gemmatimonadaceae bacterium]|nr:hypothetical protein [Gemmatimonadaceae bacterium]